MSNIFLDSRFSWHNLPVKLPEGFNEESTPIFNLTIPISNNWDQRKKKLLIIGEHVDSGDLRSGAVCSTFYGGLLSSLLKEAIDYANLVCNAGHVKDFGVAVLNFQSFKHYHLDPRRQTIAEKAMTGRVEKAIAKLQPTHVLVLGDRVARHLLKDEHYRETRGWVKKHKRDWGSFLACATIDPADLIVNGSNLDAALDGDDDEEEGNRDLYAKTNLLGQVYRDMSHIFTYGNVEDPYGLPFSINGAEYKHHLITSMSKVEKVWQRCMDAAVVAIDTEARSLNRIDNNLLTIQLSTDAHRSFILPFNHRESPFGKKEQQEIADMMYELLCNPKVDPFGMDRYLVGTNLQFDLTQLRERLNIPLVTWPLFDIQNADFILDENISEMDQYAGTTPKAFSLAAIATRYGSLAYLEKEGFNKQDRSNMEATSLDDETVVEYMGLDCFDEHTRVLTERGVLGIQQLVHMKEPRPRVWSFDPATGDTSLRTITWVSEHTTPKAMYEIEYEGGTLRVTEDHLVWSVTRNEYVKVQDLLEGEELLAAQPA